MLHRTTKGGLGHAYLAGFARALAAGAQLVIEMDADFSHDPRYLRDLLNAAEDADLVLGSRYVAGGGVRDWGLVRRLISRGHSNREIAAEVHLSENTVKTHVQEIFRKLGVRNRVEAAIEAGKSGWI